MTVLWRPKAASSETILLLPEEPIFNELVRRWSDTVRTVPGQDDQEWDALAGASAWPQATGRRRLVTPPPTDGWAPPVTVSGPCGEAVVPSQPTAACSERAQS
jgi:hypothetical protein